MILWGYLSKRRHRQFYLLLALMIIASFAEIISIGAILPFLGVLISPDQVYQYSITQPIIEFLEISDPTQLMLPVTIVFIVASLLAGSIRLLLLYVMTKLSFITGADLSIMMYRITLYQDYPVHIARNSSAVIDGIISKTGGVIGGIINPVLMLISSVILIAVIISALFTIAPVITTSIIAAFGMIYFSIINLTKLRLERNGRCIAEQSTQRVKALQEGLGGIRDILIDGSQQFYCELYRSADTLLRQASASNAFINGSPRFVIESLGMVLISIVAYSMVIIEAGLTTTVIPVLGTLALGAQRLLPSLQQAYGAYSTMKGAQAVFQDVLDLLEQPLPAYVNQPPQIPIRFEQKIELRNMSFRYAEDTPWILKDSNLIIPKGARIGFMGTTGSGKSTLLDVIMGLLPPTNGELIIDNQLITSQNIRSWQAHIAHVPQNIYLSDSSVEENIAFGVRKEDIDHQRVEKAAHQAQIAELIENWKDGYQTLVGERGIRLSGGQRQRIAIARAAYKQADVLIFDEATSALDSETEQEVMKAIKSLDRDLTILMISHRLITLKECDSIIMLGKNNAISTTSYQALI